MMLKSLLAVAAFVATAAADYHCMTNLGKFTIKETWADAAFRAGGTTTGKSGFPHAFGGQSGGGAQLKFYGADARCNEKNPKLFEFPVMKDGTIYPKDEKHDRTRTPARVVYLQDGKTLCGVMTHVIEDKNDHHGSGDFRVCDK
ncbi:chitin synthase activator (Chs3) [Purpureocillium lavendulum]|uniref:Chitin synthase activator (Chs3) n=1 Tax=Purpureocillium lavendulum TaxID=1247861 RepID=A0AB34FLK4_9HYPO|nr:chitin synthase activator (Chs3) [Purpureocillium lavendulum]